MPSSSRPKIDHPGLKTGLSVSDLVQLRGWALEHWPRRGAHATAVIQDAFFAALQRLPRARLLRLVFSDGISTWELEQASVYSFQVRQRPQRPGRPRLTRVNDDAVHDYRLLLHRLQLLRTRILTGKIVLSPTTNLATALEEHLAGAAKNLVVTAERLSIRRPTGLRHLKSVKASDFRRGQFVPHVLAREWVARLYGCSPATIRDRKTAVRQTAKKAPKNQTILG